MKTYNSFTGRLRKGDDGHYRAVMKYSDIIMAMVPHPADQTFGLTKSEIEVQLDHLTQRAHASKTERGKKTVVAFDMANVAAAYAELHRALAAFGGGAMVGRVGT